VEYVFPEMIVPADSIKTIMVPVELAPAARVAPVTSTVTAVRQSAMGQVRVPVEYVFPKMIVPADIIRTIMVPVELAISTALPPRRSGMVPPVSGSVGQGITPPEAPMTQAEQIIYSRMDYYENVKVEVAPKDGASARIVTPPKSPHVELTVSGDV
jgi:hypothetical protein